MIDGSPAANPGRGTHLVAFEVAQRAHAVVDRVGRFLADWPGPPLPDLPLHGEVIIWVLGYRLTPDGAAEPRLLDRLATAQVLAGRQPTAHLLLSGGCPGQSARSEAAVMAEYLRGAGVDPARLWLEDVSLETLDNVVYARPWLTPDATVVLVSEDPHLARAAAIIHLTGWVRSLYCVSSGPPVALTAIDYAETYRECLRLAGFPLYSDRAIDLALAGADQDA